MKTLVIVNPNSANGRTGRDWSTMEQSLRHSIGDFSVHFTAAQMDATRLVRAGLEDGVERIIAVGGDGTNNEVVNGFFAAGASVNPDACLGFIPRGTGGDLRKSLGVGRKLADCLPVLARNRTKAVDVGLTSFSGPDGQPSERYFINITSFGIGGLVDKRVNQSTKVLGGKASFLIGTLKAMAEYRNQTITLKVDEQLEETMRINNVAVANGQYFGGGMWIAPEASLDDGLFDVIILGDLTKLEMITGGSSIYKGTHLDKPKIKALRGRVIEARSDEEVLIDMDGEQPGRLPIRLEVIPRAIKLIVP